MVALPPLQGPGRLIEDRYLGGTRLRLRRATEGTGTVWKLGRKYGATERGVEPITNLYLTAAEYALLAALPGADLVKHRHDIWTDDGRFVLDVFGGTLAGRMIAEVGAEDPAALWAVRPPPWCGREITGEEAYSGAALVRSGWPADPIP